MPGGWTRGRECEHCGAVGATDAERIQQRAQKIEHSEGDPWGLAGWREQERGWTWTARRLRGRGMGRGESGGNPPGTSNWDQSHQKLTEKLVVVDWT